MPGYVAGTEVYTFNLARALKALGIECIVLIPNLGKDINNEYLYQNIRVIQYSENSISDRKMILGLTRPEGVKTFTAIIKKEQPSIVHFHELVPGQGINIFLVQAVAGLGIKIVFTCHVANYSCNTGNLKYKEADYCDGFIDIKKCTACSYQARHISGKKASLLELGSGLLYSAGINPLHWNNSLGTALGFPFLVKAKKLSLQKLGQLADRIVVLTNWYQQVLERNGIAPDKITLVTQGIESLNYTPAPKPSAGLPIKLVFIGRISYLKGLHLLLEALKQMETEKIHLDIYGADREDDYAAHCRALSGGMNNVNWKGEIAGEQVIPMLSAYHLLCLPSTFSEMSPLVIQEAYAAGIPVIASDAPGNAAQIRDGINGWLFKFKNATQLSEKLNDIIHQPSLLDNARKQLPPVKEFAAVAEEHLVLYNALLKEKRTVSST